MDAFRRVFPEARPSKLWSGVETWAAPRPEAAIVDASTGTYDPKSIVLGVAERKTGLVVYFLDPGDYFALETHEALLTSAGFRLGRGCIYPPRRSPVPVEPLEELFRRARERDEKAASRGGVSPASGPPAKPKSVDAYLEALPDDQRHALERVRDVVRKAAPGVTEKIAYGMPTFVHAGRNLVHMAAFREHCSFFPGSSAVTALLASKLEGYETAKGTIRFTPAKPIPAALLKDIVRMRIAEVEAAAKPRSRARPAKEPALRGGSKAARKGTTAKGGGRKAAKRPRGARS